MLSVNNLIGFGGRRQAAAGGGITDPTDLTNLFAWWDGDQDVTVTTSPSVDSWDDQVSAYSLTPPGTEPHQTTSDLNGHDTILQESGGGTGALDFPSGFYNGLASNNTTSFLVVNQHDAVDNSGRAVSVGRYNSYDWGFGHDPTNGWYFASNNAGTIVTPGDGDDFGSWRILCGYRDGTEQGINIDGGTFATSTDADNLATSSMTGKMFSDGGGGSTLFCKIAELIVYTEKKSADDIAAVITYLQNKYAL